MLIFQGEITLISKNLQQQYHMHIVGSTLPSGEVGESFAIAER